MKGHITKRSPGSWSIVINLGKDETGKRRQKWYTFHCQKKGDAEAEMARILHELATGSAIETKRMSVADYLERWLEDYAKPSVSPRTFEIYTYMVRKHIIPGLGKHLLEKLKPLHIQHFYADRRSKDKGNLSAQTVLHIHKLLKQALAQGVRWQLLIRNPADAVEAPKVARREMQTLSTEQINAAIEVLKCSVIYIPMLIAAYTGMRRGEVLALKWQDIDLDNGLLAVRRAFETTVGRVIVKEPKTAAGRRVIAISQTLVVELRRHKAEQAQRRLLMGMDYINEDWVCAHENGQMIKPVCLSDKWRRFRKLVGVTLGLHALRHSHATIMLESGVHPKVVSERLGHSSYGITQDLYTHVMPQMQEDAANRFDEAMRKKKA
jgi:integrase